MKVPTQTIKKIHSERVGPTVIQVCSYPRDLKAVLWALAIKGGQKEKFHSNMSFEELDRLLAGGQPPFDISVGESK